MACLREAFKLCGVFLLGVLSGCALWLIVSSLHRGLRPFCSARPSSEDAVTASAPATVFPAEPLKYVDNGDRLGNLYRY